MPQTKKFKKLKSSCQKEYGKKKGERIAYATAKKRVGELKIIFIVLILLIPLTLSSIKTPSETITIASNDLDIEPLADNVNTPYTYIAPSGKGTFGHYIINTKYCRDWLNSTVIWKVEKSTDGITWKDYTKFEVKKVWNEKTLTEKHTVIVTSDEDAYYRILTNTNKDKNLIYYSDKSALGLQNGSNDFITTFKVGDDQRYSLIYNWDDYLNSPISSTTTFSKEILTEQTTNKKSFSWSIVSNSKILNKNTFVLDPIYGIISNAVVDTWEYDPEEAEAVSKQYSIRINETDYYISIAKGDTGSDGDGFIRTLHVWNSNGTIHETVIEAYEYDTSDGAYAYIEHINNTDKYVVSYRDATQSVIFTIPVSETGDIGAIIDTQAQNTPDGKRCSDMMLFWLTDRILVIVEYHESSVDGFIETWWIDANGAINNSQLDYEEFDNVFGEYGYGCKVDADTIALTYADTHQTTGDYTLMTYNISATGIITDTPADTWTYEAEPYYHSIIKKIGSDKYAITYTDNGYDVNCKTLTISDAGVITKSWIDTLEVVNGAELGNLNTFIVNDPITFTNGVMGCTVKGIGAGEADGYTYTWNVSSDGTLGNAIIDSLEFEAADCGSTADVVYMGNNYYLICYSKSDADGFISTITIETNLGYSLPVVLTNATTAIAANTATANGYLQSNGSASTTCGFRTGTINGTWSANHTVGVTGTATAFTHSLTGLLSGTLYYIQAWASNSVGFVTGDVKNFTTLSVISLSNENPVDTQVNVVFTEVTEYEWALDLDDDGYLGEDDANELILHWGETGAPGWIKEDVHADGVINLLDASGWVNAIDEVYGILLQVNITHSIPATICNATFKSNYTGSWTTLGWDNNVNITRRWGNHSWYDDLQDNTQYWWSVNVTDNAGNWTNATYTFTTAANTILITSATPSNVSDIYPFYNNLLYSSFSETQTYPLNITFKTNASGSWNTIENFIKIYPFNWWNTSWKWSNKIILNHTHIPSLVHNIPVLIYIDNQTMINKMNANFSDIRFLNAANTTEYSYEIDCISTTYTYPNKYLWIWVNITTIKSASDTIIFMYYGNQNASPVASSTGVFNPPGYNTVYHFSDLNNHTSENSSTGFNNGTVVNWHSHVVYGWSPFKLGGGIIFLKSLNPIGSIYNISWYNNTKTWEFWYWAGWISNKNTTIIGNWQINGSNEEFRSIGLDQNNYISMAYKQCNLSNETGISGAGMHHMLIDWINNSIWIDGEYAGQKTCLIGDAPFGKFMIGAQKSNDTGVGRFYINGVYIDEFRATNLSVNADWIKADYEAQSYYKYPYYTYNSTIKNDFVTWGEFNQSVAVISYNTSWINCYNHSYWWSVNITDNFGTWENHTFNFSTTAFYYHAPLADIDGTSINLLSPIMINLTDVLPNPTINFSISLNTILYYMNFTSEGHVKTNASGTWQTIFNWTDNHTYIPLDIIDTFNFNLTNITDAGRTYWINISVRPVVCGASWSNYTFSFTLIPMYANFTWIWVNTTNATTGRIYFVSTSSANCTIDYYLWTFGDGDYSGDKKIVHRFLTLGDMTVTLCIENVTYGLTACYTETINIPSTAITVAGFNPYGNLDLSFVFPFIYILVIIIILLWFFKSLETFEEDVYNE